MGPQISFKISCVRKIQSCLTEPIEHSQQYTDTVIDLNLNTNHLIDQPFSMDQQEIVSATGTIFNGIVERELGHL